MQIPYDSFGGDRAPCWLFLGEGFWGNIQRPLVLPALCFAADEGTNGKQQLETPSIQLGIPAQSSPDELVGRCQRTTARKTTAISTRKCSCQKLATHVQLLSRTSSQPDFERALSSRKIARNRRGRILYTELLKSWSTLGQFLANSPSHGKLQGPSLQ